MDEVTIKVRHNGPYLVRGPVRLFDADGNDYVVEGDDIALCRCGGSTKKPFCDGTHSKIAFQAAERAVAQAADDGAEAGQERRRGKGVEPPAG